MNPPIASSALEPYPQLITDALEPPDEPPVRSGGITLRYLDALLHPMQPTLPRNPLSLLLRRQALSIPIDADLDRSPNLRAWWYDLGQCMPEVFEPQTMQHAELIAPIVTHQQIYYLQVTAGAIKEQCRGRNGVPTGLTVFSWGVRPEGVQWYDQVLLWVAAEFYISESPEAVSLQILALNESKETVIFNVQNDRTLHQETGRWLKQLLMQSEMGQTVTIPEPSRNLTDLLDIASIPEFNPFD